MAWQYFVCIHQITVTPLANYLVKFNFNFKINQKTKAKKIKLFLCKNLMNKLLLHKYKLFKVKISKSNN